MTRRSRRQLVLELAQQSSLRLAAQRSPELVKALAELLLEALGGGADDEAQATGGVMNPKITPDHLGRGAVVYVRQSSMGQVAENLRPRDVGVEVFQSQSKLIAIEPFRPASELRALQALDDEPEPIHLGTRRSKSRVIIGHLGGELAHQPMQCIDIDRQRGEIEIHARDSNTGR
jgi:hypothetical protein